MKRLVCFSVILVLAFCTSFVYAQEPLKIALFTTMLQKRILFIPLLQRL
jgi:hypothetical protein